MLLVSWFIIDFSDNSYQEWLRKSFFGTADDETRYSPNKADTEWKELQRKAEESEKSPQSISHMMPEMEGA
jgi:hypothetical protein